MLGASSPLSIPYSKAEAVLTKLQEASVASNLAGCFLFYFLFSLIAINFYQSK
jgi:hypothetical protein